MKRISFSYPLPQAIREGTKTQTRRIIKEALSWDPFWKVSNEGMGNYCMRVGTQYSIPYFKCPHQVGDILAVIEEHYMFGHWEPDNTRKRKTGRQAWRFVQDSPEIVYRENPLPNYRKGRHSADPSTPAWHKRLARFMPAHAVRTYIQLTNIKVERLEDISKEDAIKEGIKCIGENKIIGGNKYLGKLYENYGTVGYVYLKPLESFKSLWQSINGEDSWNANPWVWVFEFKQVEKLVV